VAVCGTPALRRLAGGARSLMKSTNLATSTSASESSTNIPMLGQKVSSSWARLEISVRVIIRHFLRSRSGSRP
jgi:hypothetical protein